MEFVGQDLIWEDFKSNIVNIMLENDYNRKDLKS